MKCPNDGATLSMSERSGVEIDYCPECRGVWLDRGELDKILDRAAAVAPPVTQPQHTPIPQTFGGDAYGRPYRKKKRESWLSEIFD